MRGTSAASLASVAAGYEPVVRAAGPDATTLGGQLLSVVDALDGSGSLRRALSDPSRSAEAKASLAATLLRGKVDDRVVDVVAALARARWTQEHDFTDAVEELAADSVLAAAQSAGVLEQVEDELFRFDRLLIGQRDLRRALTERSVPGAARGTLVRNLIEGKVRPETLQLVERAAVTPRGRTMSAALGLLSRLSARRRALMVAAVTSASPLSLAQMDRLRQLLERAYGGSIQLNLTVDPQVIGGLRVQVGAEVVDSTVLGRLDDARRQLAR
ncbi:MAG TPA: F0F1 ATP synthase subunit delta [Actinotalea sp.]|jgi:F-type H+-transporting ATPase subunit delta